jgi:acetylornithine deacetylase/succinyl-diaminopimelate desuccinylase-like protein
MTRPSFAARETYLTELQELLRIPSVSCDPGAEKHMRRAAEWLAGRLSGFRGRVIETAGHPVVMGEWPAPAGAPTLLVYGHYDVQPAGDEARWTSPPFAPEVRDGRIHARGASDDKGPMLVPVMVAREWLACGGPPVGLRFLFEGEEEIGSPSLEAVLREHRDELAADMVISADGAMWRADEPSLTVAAKGLVALTLEVRGPACDLHSGRHGGAVVNPLQSLAAILASLHQPDGTVAVDGFADGIEPLTADERAELARVAFDEQSYRASVGVSALGGEPGYSVLERLWTRPTLEINGVAGGSATTVIPAIATAHLSCRLVPAQDPERVVAAMRAHIAARVPDGVTATLDERAGSTPAYRIDPDHPGLAAAELALRQVYPDREPLRVRMGGTLPAATLFQRVLGLQIVFFSFSTGDERFHAPDEFFRLQRLWDGLDAWARLWELLAGPEALSGRAR